MRKLNCENQRLDESIFQSSSNMATAYVSRFNELVESHTTWKNPLLQACKNNLLNKDELKLLFEQYYFYSKNFTKLIAAAMLGCDSDLHRAKLAENLWEEGGEDNHEERHAELFRRFLSETLNIGKLSKIDFKLYTKHFFSQYLNLCLTLSPFECAAVLAFATEGIVSKLYKLLIKNLEHEGYNKDQLKFFYLHIDCDDEHAQVLETISLDYMNEPLWFEKSCDAINTALCLRDEFFTNIYKDICRKRSNNLLIDLSKSNIDMLTNTTVININSELKTLYTNSIPEKNIEFTVSNLITTTDTLHPRLLEIKPGKRNEQHNHAHETVMFVLQGTGMVQLGSRSFDIHEGDLIHIPRWCEHMTQNTGNLPLKIYAVTDFLLTSKLIGSQDIDYRTNY